MSPATRRVAGTVAALFLATLAQAVFASPLQVAGARPDFLLCVALILSLFTHVNGAATTGFFAGLLHASLAAPPAGGFGSLIVSRMLVCALVGWLEERLYRDHLLSALMLVITGTALAELLYFVIAPHPNIPHWARHMGMTALYNGALSPLLYPAVRRLIGAHRTRDMF
ncbi:MAG: rod shape-determining protein MreD [Chloroherpetonaceae bacterium]|nr:rod shape-determining protein MreD [Chthonomonadaceae bacterium]MDW8208653.1 rod shape-determining protein MreD [Chloroherpetonaceae bacterium]